MFGQAGMAKTTVLVIVALVIVALAIVGVVVLSGDGVEVTVTEEEINNNLAEAFPITKSAGGILGITFQTPAVELTAGSDRMVVGMEATASLQIAGIESSLSGSAVVETGIGFNSDTGDVLLVEPSVVEIDIEGVPGEFTDMAAQVADQVASGLLDGYPIYTIDASDVPTAIADLFLQDVKIEDGQVVLSFGF